MWSSRSLPYYVVVKAFFSRNVTTHGLIFVLVLQDDQPSNMLACSRTSSAFPAHPNSLPYGDALGLEGSDRIALISLSHNSAYEQFRLVFREQPHGSLSFFGLGCLCLLCWSLTNTIVSVSETIGLLFAYAQTHQAMPSTSLTGRCFTDFIVVTGYYPLIKIFTIKCVSSKHSPSLPFYRKQVSSLIIKSSLGSVFTSYLPLISTSIMLALPKFPSVLPT